MECDLQPGVHDCLWVSALSRRLHKSVGYFLKHKDQRSTQKLTVYVQIDNYAMHRVLERNRLFLTSRYDTLKIFKILYSSTNDRIRCTQIPCMPGVRKVPLICPQSLNRSQKIQLTLTFNGVGKITKNSGTGVQGTPAPSIRSLWMSTTFQISSQML